MIYQLWLAYQVTVVRLTNVVSVLRQHHCNTYLANKHPRGVFALCMYSLSPLGNYSIFIIYGSCDYMWLQEIAYRISFRDTTKVNCYICNICRFLSVTIYKSLWSCVVIVYNYMLSYGHISNNYSVDIVEVRWLSWIKIYPSYSTV